VVVGGGLAGLAAARVLAAHVARVTLVERDRLPAGPARRPGVPQAAHVHNLLARGRRALEGLFPGLDAELAAAGAPAVDWTADARWYYFGGWRPRFPSGIVSRTCTRPLLEWAVRRRLLAAGGGRVTVLEGHAATGLVPGRAGRGGPAVAGVRLTPHGGRSGGAGDDRGPAAAAGEAGVGPVELAADLVVDASGRDSRAPEWLAALGYGRAPETTVDSFLGYASRLYAPPAGARHDWRTTIVAATPPARARAGGIVPVEGGRWLVTLAGAARDYPPTDEAGFLAFLASLPVPDLADALRGATPLSPVAGYRRTANRWRHYERLPRWPAGFAVTGDAACAFNPVYGQGMTVAALGALALDASLRAAGGADPSAARRFRRRLARAVRLPWLMATGEDFRYPTTAGRRPGPAAAVLHRYLDGVLLAAAEHPAAHRAFLAVTHLLESPAALLHPAVALPALAALARGRPGR
jgi:flavin-dependent dehydrogenase